MGLIKNPNGSWSIGGVSLPDFGITEAIGDRLGVARDTTTGGSAVNSSIGNTTPYTNNFVSTQYPTNAYAGNVPAKTTGSGTGNGTGNTLLPTTNNTTPPPSGPSEADQLANQIRQQIEGGYSNYFQSLDNQIEYGLPQQATIQNQMIDNSLASGMSDLDSQKAMGESDLARQSDKINTSQVKTLKDVSSNIRNLMSAGNTYLGSRGAGDSSATNQYSYAITKLGSQQRGDVMSQTRQLQSEIDDKVYKLSTAYNNEKNKMNLDYSNKKSEVSLWLIEAQNELRRQKASGMLSRSADLNSLATNLYNQAVTKLQNLEAQYQAQQTGLTNWVLQNSNSVAEVVKGLKQIGSYVSPTQNYSQIQNPFGSYQAPSQTPVYGGNAYQEDEDLFN